MKEILERYISPSSTNSSTRNPASPKAVNGTHDISVAKSKPASSYIPANLQHEELKKLIQLIIKIDRQEGAGLGIRIAGGKGSNPYKDDDDGIFITRILPESPAKPTGLKVGDKLVKVNQTCLNDLTHQQAADALKEAVKSDNQLIMSVLQETDLNKLFFLQIDDIEATTTATSDQIPANELYQYGFRINYNFNTYQQREVEIISIADAKRYSQLAKGDILLQINGRNVDSISEKDLNRFVQNSSSSTVTNEFTIKYLTVYRPYVEEANTQEANTSVNEVNGDAEIVQNGTEAVEAQKPSAVARQPNGLPISSSTPLRNPVTPPQNDEANTSLTTAAEDYPIEEVKLVKHNGAMGLSIVGGGNVACHPFGIDNPGIFISKIVPGGAASGINLRVGDRILKVNGVDVTQMTHDDTVNELKRHSSQVVLLVRHDPQPPNIQDVILHRSYPEETIGIRINGGIEMKSANVYDSSDEGIFVVNIINGTLAHKDTRLQVGTRIMEVSY